MTKEFRIEMALTLCKEFKESNTKAMVEADKRGNKELAHWYQGKICAYDQVIDMLEN